MTRSDGDDVNEQLAGELLRGINTSNFADVLSFAANAAVAKPDFEYHQGLVLDWNSVAGTNRVRVLGRDMDNLPVLTSAGVVSMMPGTTVGIIKYRYAYFIIGRIVSQDSNLVNPQFPIVLYPNFTSLGTAGAPELRRATVGQFTGWNAYANVTQPYITLSGVFGTFSGTNSTTYDFRIDGDVIGQWTETSLVGPVIRGPYDVSSYIGTTGFFGGWNTIEVIVSATSGTGTYVNEIYSCFFQSY